MIFAKIEKDDLLTVYAVLMEPKSDQDEENTFGACLKAYVEENVTIEGESSRVEWIMSEMWGSSEIKVIEP